MQINTKQEQKLENQTSIPASYKCMVITVSILGVVVFVPWQQEDQNVWHHDSKWHFHSWLSLKYELHFKLNICHQLKAEHERKQHHIL